MKTTYLYIIMMFIALGLASCSDDDGGGQPVINSVRLTTNADSTFTEAQRGTMLLIQGNNIGGVVHAYINNLEVSFNSTYNTNNYMILTIPSNLNLSDSNVQHEIKLETSHGTAVYAFRVVAPLPILTEYKAEWGIDAEGNRHIMPGQELTLVGENFYDVEHIYLADSADGSGNKIEITDYSINNTQTEIVLTMPETIPDVAYFILECYQGDASVKFNAKPAQPVIESVSSDMPIQGEAVTLTGRNFLDITSIIIGERTVTSENITVSEDAKSLTFIMPEAPSVGGTLTLVSSNGRTSIDFYDVSSLIANFDTTPGWFSWGGMHFTQSNGANAPAHHSGNIHGLEGKPGAWNWWWGQLYFGGFAMPSSIPANTSISDIELRFEYYVGAAIDNGPQFSIYLSNDESHTLNNIVMKDYQTGTNNIGHWNTFSAPFSSFTSVSTFGNYTYSGDFALRCTNPSGNGDAQVIFYIDNIRLYVKK